MLRQIQLPALTAVFSLLLIVPAAGAPSLTLGSNANYQLTAMLSTLDSCSSPNATIAFYVCGTTSPITPSSATVNAFGNGSCSPGGSDCGFSPADLTVNIGTVVTWRNLGNLTHTVTSNSTNWNFFSNYLYPGSFVTFSFSNPGTYKYYCQFHNWMKGTVNVVTPPPPPPKVQNSLSTGSLGWTVVGLDDDALLSISHDVSVHNATEQSTDLLLHESGIVEESVELSTRIESGGTVSLFSPFPYLTSYPSIGYVSGYPGLYSFYPYYYLPTIHTIWWVNGPLEIGSNVEVLTGYASVRDQTSLDLGTIGTHDAWVVRSLYSQRLNQPVPSSLSQSTVVIGPGPFPYSTPYPQYYVANSTNALSLEFDYGKQSDLLFKAAAEINSYSEVVTVYPPGSYIYSYFSGSIYIQNRAEVTRVHQSALTVTLDLAGTNLDLTRRTIPEHPTGPSSDNSPSDGTTSQSQAQAAIIPLLYGATGVAAGAVVSGGLWLATRNRRKNQTPSAVLSTSA